MSRGDNHQDQLNIILIYNSQMISLDQQIGKIKMATNYYEIILKIKLNNA